MVPWKLPSQFMRYAEQTIMSIPMKSFVLIVLLAHLIIKWISLIGVEGFP